MDTLPGPLSRAPAQTHTHTARREHTDAEKRPQVWSHEQRQIYVWKRKQSLKVYTAAEVRSHKLSGGPS